MSGEHADVVIVGAGIAGLSTARHLLAAGRSALVLESRDRVGGRLRSEQLTDGSGSVDLGGTWFWPGETRVADLVAELGLATHPQHLAGDAAYHDPGGARRLDGNPIDVPAWRFSDGAQSLATALATALPDDTVRLGTVVTDVVDGDTLTVHHPTGTISTNHVVLALPPALAISRIRFEPPLPDPIAGLAAVTPIWMGSTTKVVAHYDRPFWRERGLSGSAISHIGPMREIHDMSGPNGQPAALFGFIPTTGAGGADPFEIRRQLSELFGPEAADPVELVIADWSDEPDTSPPGVDRLGAYQAFGHDLYQRPALDGRLHWASTETATVAPGHIEGALQAAERTAAAILDHATSPTPT